MIIELEPEREAGGEAEEAEDAPLSAAEYVRLRGSRTRWLVRANWPASLEQIRPLSSAPLEMAPV